jgi:hypothetical protein
MLRPVCDVRLCKVSDFSVLRQMYVVDEELR